MDDVAYAEANKILSAYYKDTNRWKSAKDEYPILSLSQIKRRKRNEIFYGNFQDLSERGFNMNDFKKGDGSLDALDKVNYDTEQLKNIIKYMSALEGSDNANEIALLTDIKTALGMYENDKAKRVLTPKQKIAITKYLVEDKEQAVVADEMGITQQGVSLLIKHGLVRIQKFLANEQITKIFWTFEEKEKLLLNYPILGPQGTADLLGIDKSKVVSMYHILMQQRKSAED